LVLQILLLENAVAAFAPHVFALKFGTAPVADPQAQSAASSKVPWTKVAEEMSSRGSSYPFANATCRKKWDELKPPLRKKDASTTQSPGD